MTELASIERKLKNKILVPVGGGKDSVVTLEILKRADKDISCFVLNPTKTAKKIMKIARCQKPIIVERNIDKSLLELNRKGFFERPHPFFCLFSFFEYFDSGNFRFKIYCFF